MAALGTVVSVVSVVSVAELGGAAGVVALLDAAIGPIKVLVRGLGARQLLMGMSVAQLAGRIISAVRPDTGYFVVDLAGVNESG